jgi:hypothetical protein
MMSADGKRELDGDAKVGDLVVWLRTCVTRKGPEKGC